MKHHVKALPKESICFEYPATEFDSTSYEKLKEAIFIEYEIRKSIAPVRRNYESM